MRKSIRPDAPQAASFQVSSCGDPDCGAHIIGLDDNDKPICEIVVARRFLRSLIEAMQKLAYEKATEKF